jgi:hypothetical protein
MQVNQFIAKWKANTRAERSASQEHFLDLCALLNEPTPNSDPTGSAYAFEKGATKASGGDGWADVWRRGYFAWEYKGKHKDLDAAHRQLLQYAGALENPPLLVTSDIERITIRTNWTNEVSERHELRLEELSDPLRLDILKSVFSNPNRLRPCKTRAALTAEAAADFAELAGRLRERGNDPQIVAHFVNRLVFCLFADDVDLLPQGLFERMLDGARKAPARFEAYAHRLFAAMATRGGDVDFTPVAWFNGGLFDDDMALPLEADDIALLQRAAALDWAEVDPSILGTLFERGLDPNKRSQLGAHYTSREMIERIIHPVVRHPLLLEWKCVQSSIAAKMEPARRAVDEALDRASRHAELVEEVRVVRRRLLARSQMELFPELKKQRRLRSVDVVRLDLRRSTEQLNTALRESDGAYRTFLSRLRSFRVLDPACGSGNFLYLALLALKDLEHQAMVEAEVLGLQREFPQVGPEAVLGLELNAYAAELARVSVWIGHIQWARRHGFPAPSDPVLQKLETIACCDAVLATSGAQAQWPDADVIVGNPPFLGMKKQIKELGAAYTRQLRRVYKDQIPAASDLACYWFEKARSAIVAGTTRRVGLVAPQNIKSGYSRLVLDRMRVDTTIYEAWTNILWPLAGASVRVSLICFGNAEAVERRLDGTLVTSINADLSASAADITTARRLPENFGVAFSGTVKGGKLDVSGTTARKWLAEPANANGRSNSDVLMPWVNASDMTGRARDMWIIDFGNGRPQQDAAYYASPFAYASTIVKPKKEKSTKYGARWWLLSEWCPGMRRAIMPLHRYIATPTGTSHRVFVWLDSRVQPDHQLVAIARDDDTCFGILHSRFHEAWTRRLSSSLGVGDDPRYNPATVFETFPFPDNLMPTLSASSYASDPRARRIAQAARDLVTARDRWLNPSNMTRIVAEVVAGFPARVIPKDAQSATALRSRTLTSLYNQRGTPQAAWLDALHATLDQAVADAYCWPASLDDDDALARLLALNHARSQP